MNKALSRFLAFTFSVVIAVVFAAATPAYAQTQVVGDVQIFGNDANLAFRLNNTLPTLTTVLNNAQITLGDVEFFNQIAANLNLSVVDLQTQFTASGMPLNTFLTARLIANAANIPLADVLARFNAGATLGNIAVDLGVGGTVNTNLANLINTLTNASGGDIVINIGGGGSASGGFSLRLVNQFNANAQLFGNIILNADTVLSRPQIFQLISTGLGIPVVQLENDFINLGLPLNTFLTAQVIAQSANVPVQFVIQRMELGQDLGRLAIQLGTPIRLASLRFVSFVRAFTTAMGSGSSTVVVDNSVDARARLIAEFERILAALEARCDVLEARLGTQVFERVFINRLAIETGIATDILFTARVNIPRNVSLAQFGAAVLLEDSLEGALRFVLENNDMALFTPFGIIGAMNGQAVSAQLFSQRVAIFTKSLSGATV